MGSEEWQFRETIAPIWPRASVDFAMADPHKRADPDAHLGDRVFSLIDGFLGLDRLKRLWAAGLDDVERGSVPSGKGS